jgi:hypothetical protein
MRERDEEDPDGVVMSGGEGEDSDRPLITSVWGNVSCIARGRKGINSGHRNSHRIDLVGGG